MEKISRFTACAARALTLFIVATTPVLAVDPVCNQLKTAMQGLRTMPVHIYMTETQSFPNKTMAKTAGQIGMGGTTQSEEISTSETVYVMNDGKWIDMQISFASMEEDKDSDPDIKEAMDKSTCKVLPDETAYGQPAKVYLRSTPELGIESKIWISKSTSLVLRTDMTNDQGAMKMVTVSRYEYSGVQAPAHATLFKDMAAAGSGR